MNDERPDRAEHRPSVSVVLFVRNMARTIERALASVLSQADADFELLVFDGASSDGTAEILGRYRDRFAFFSPGPDGGPAYAINDGVARARGDAIVLLAGDDWLEPGSLRRIAAAFRADPALDVLSCGVRVAAVDAAGALTGEALYDSDAALEFTMEKVVRFPLTHGRILRKRAYDRIGPYDTSIPLTHDLDFLIRCLLARLRWQTSPGIVYTFVEHAGSSTLSGTQAGALRMARDNCGIAARYLREAALDKKERGVLRELLARSAAKCIKSYLLDGAYGEAWKYAKLAFRGDPLWPFTLLRIVLARPPDRRR